MQPWRGQSYKDCKPKAWLMFGQRKREKESISNSNISSPLPPWRVFEPSVIQTLWPVFVWRTRLTFGVYLITVTCWFYKLIIHLLMELRFQPSFRRIKFYSQWISLSFILVSRKKDIHVWPWFKAVSVMLNFQPHVENSAFVLECYDGKSNVRAVAEFFPHTSLRG